MIDIKTLDYNNYCAHCKWMKRHPAYTEALFSSSYYEEDGQLSIPQTMLRFQCEVNITTVYNCLKRHYKHIKGVKRTQLAKIEENKLKETEKLLETDSTDPHEIALDEFIALGRNKVRTGEIPITGQQYIAAINAKANIQKNNKDRKLDMLKTMFAGAAPQEHDETKTV